MLSIMADYDSEDSFSLASKPYIYDNYTQFLQKDGFKGMRIGIPRNPFYNTSFTGVNESVYEAVEATFDKMRSLGATIVDPVEFPNAEDYAYGFPGASLRTYNASVRIRKLATLLLLSIKTNVIRI